MDLRDRLMVLTLIGVVALAVTAGLAIWAIGGLRPRRDVGPHIETAVSGRLSQTDSATGELLWEVLTGEISHEAGSSIVGVSDAVCLIYTDGLPEMLVRAPRLTVDDAEDVLVFDLGAVVESQEGADSPYSGQADRLIYYVAERRARLETKAVLKYGRTTFLGSVVDAWFERAEDFGRSRLARCEVTPMPSEAGKRAIVALIALATAASSDAQRQRHELQNAVVMAERVVVDFTGGKVSLIGTPEIQIGESSMTAERIECSLDPDKPGQLLAAESFGEVVIRSVQILEQATMTRVEKKRVTVIRCRSATYSAADRTARLTGGVSGTLDQPRTETSTFEAREIVGHFDDAGTLKRISAYGSPVTAKSFTQEGDEYHISAASVEYLLDDPPSVVATGQPSIRDNAGTSYSAAKIVVRFTSDSEGRTTASEAALTGGFVAVSKDEEENSWGEIHSSTAVVNLAEDRVQIRGSPRILLKRYDTGEVATEITCDELDRDKDQKLYANGNVRVESHEDGTVATGDRAVADLNAGRGLYEITGNACVDYPGRDDSESRRPVRITASKIAYDKPSKEESYLAVTAGRIVIAAAKEGEDDIVVLAPAIRMNRKNGELVASGRPKVTSGETTLEANEVRLTMDPETNEVSDGLAVGDVKLHARVEQKPSREGGTVRTRIINGTGQRATFRPSVPIPSDLPDVQPGETANRFQLTGDPYLVGRDAETDELWMEFRRVEVIDVYTVDKRILADARGAQGPSELIVHDLQAGTGGER